MSEMSKAECFDCGALKKEIEEMKKKQEKANKDMKEKQKALDEKMERKFDEMMENQAVNIKQGIKEVLISSVDKVESVSLSSQSAEKQVAMRPPQRHQPPINHDVIVIGGQDKKAKPIDSVERYICKEGSWVDLPPMKLPRASASSVIFDNQIIISGGYTIDPNGKRVLTDSIEIINLDKSPLAWVTAVAKLPVPVADHATFIYQGKLIVVCTFQENSSRHHKIFEVLLTAPHSAKEIFTLPRLFNDSRAQLVEDQIFIFGGTPDEREVVLIYDLVAQECRKMPGLPDAVNRMSTVVWRNQVILIGGKKMWKERMNWESESVHEIFMYSTETGESEMLPAMKEERIDSTAVLTDDVIIVVGGHYNSVEFYEFRTNTWQAFRAMKEIRSNATAVVFPV